MLVENGILKETTDKDIEKDLFTFSKNVKITAIGERAFYCCNSLKAVEIPNSITTIGANAFCNCQSLTSIEIPNGVTDIDTGVFWGCENLTSVEIPNSITTIGANAFCSCQSLTSIEIPNGVTDIGAYAFSGCELLTSIEIHSSVTNIGTGAFWNCKSIKSVEIPDSVTIIGANAFCNCQSLTSIEIPNGVTDIGKKAFYDCKSLKKVEIPDSVTDIGEKAFYGCTSLASLTIQGKKYKTVCADGYIALIEHIKKIDDYTVYKAKQFNYMKDGEIFTTDYYIAEQNEFYAHGDTIKEAVGDLLFKLAKDRGQEQYNNVDVNVQIAFVDAKNMYRVITGACQKGTKMFLNTLKTVKDTYSVKEICKLTAGQYGNEVFSRFFGL